MLPRTWPYRDHGASWLSALRQTGRLGETLQSGAATGTRGRADDSAAIERSSNRIAPLKSDETGSLTPRSNNLMVPFNAWLARKMR